MKKEELKKLNLEELRSLCKSNGLSFKGRDYQLVNTLDKFFNTSEIKTADLKDKAYEVLDGRTVVIDGIDRVGTFSANDSKQLSRSLELGLIKKV